MADLAPPLALLAQLEATGEISATMRRAGVNFYHLAQCRDRWRRFDPYRELFDALGGWDSPSALAALAVLDLAGQSTNSRDRPGAVAVSPDPVQ